MQPTSSASQIDVRPTTTRGPLVADGRKERRRYAKLYERELVTASRSPSTSVGDCVDGASSTAGCVKKSAMAGTQAQAAPPSSGNPSPFSTVRIRLPRLIGAFQTPLEQSRGVRVDTRDGRELAPPQQIIEMPRSPANVWKHQPKV